MTHNMLGFTGGIVARFDRYMLSQLILLFGFYGLVLVLLFWVNRAVRLFDQLIANGQTAMVFLEFSAMIVPGVIVFIIPIASFAAAVSVTNRLNSESELVVAQAAGFGPFRLARPVLVFGVFTALFMLVLTHVLVPMSQLRFAERQAEISENITARFLTEGSFVHPVDGVTLYIREISPAGELLDIFLSDERNAAQKYTYTAKKALILRTDAGPRLIMFDGLAQVLNAKSQRLSTTGFKNFTYDISALLSGPIGGNRTVTQIYTPELLDPPVATLSETGETRAALRAEGHFRNAQALYSVVTAMTGFSMLIVAGFSRFGLWRQVVLALGAVALLQTLDNTMLDMARRDANYLWLVYVATGVGVVLNIVVLIMASRPSPRDMRRRRRTLREMSRIPAAGAA
ncbi:lipopolysaccharide export system permease protein [Aliiroseovarius sediminilitoris]|uniref:Lipopolysaccharide export system permease protein n=1 Tax=Aliiroseovarius sediminilitoris TaxID=1173584 RepID=A0A1I0PYQ4_9RHOB|nr:LptF/LptG family permease [Aliiroseovarius sediminilitoris]SEW19598.1 lipopolysaccharide export system permease protein [Aliiroseovarius sediminilitoris]